MAQEFNRKALTLVVAQICQTIGWHSINSTPLELLVDLLHRYLFEVGKNAHLYAEQLGHTTPDLDDLGLAFQEMGINVEDLQEYVQYVDSVPFAHHVPKFPIPKESHLNFLKPGSREVVTRPVHVHEYLPPMHPEMENELLDEYLTKSSPLSVDISSPGPSSGPNSGGGSLSPQSSPKLNSVNPFKRPGEPLSTESPVLKRPRLTMEEEGRPLREISSVMMTTSGFLSPAREGKLPESRTPLQPSDSRSNSPQPSHYPAVPPEVNKPEKKLKKLLPKKPTDVTKKMDKENKKKDNREVDRIGESNVDNSNVPKLVSMKETSKLKAFKPAGVKQPGSSSVGSYKIPKVSGNKTSPKRSKLPHAQQGTSVPTSPPKLDVDEKSSSAPDRQKSSFLKKISKAKDDKPDRNDKFDRNIDSPSFVKESRPSSAGWVVDEERSKKEARYSQIDSCIDSVIMQGMQGGHENETVSKDKDKDMSMSSDSFVDVGVNNMDVGSPPLDMFNYETDSPPLTPTAPKTPEIAHVLLGKEETKKKKQEKSKLKKEMKLKAKELSPKKIKMEPYEDEILERPKTPEVKLDLKPFPYVSFPPHPGLIPPMLDSNRPENLALLNHSPPHQHGSLSPEKPVTPGAGVGGLSPHPIMQTPSSMLPYFHPSPSSTISTPTGVPPTPGGNVVPVTPGSNIPSVSPLFKKKNSEGKGKNLEKKKEHKKDKKDKKDKTKIKKKKDKKDKNKDKSLKKKDKVLKKLKEKIDKDAKHPDKPKDKIKEKKKDKKRKEDGKFLSPPQPQLLVTEELGVPKLTLRLGPDSPRPITPEATPTAPKLVIKTVKKTVSEEERMLKAGIAPQPPLFSSSHVIESESYRREKEREKEREREREKEREREREERERLEREKELERAAEKEREREREREREKEKEREWEKEKARLSALEALERTPASSGRPSKQKSKTKQGQLKLSTAKATPPLLPEDPHSKLYQTVKSSKKNDPDSAVVVDAMGNQVWICPSCKGPDDGRPMIGCDDCDAWYHWVCVNITIAPDENENWYCSFCQMKQKPGSAEKKKKKKSKKKPKVPM